MAPRKTLEESKIHPDLNVNTIAEDQIEKWETIAFFVDVSDHTVIQKIGLELNAGSKAFIGEFAVYKTRPESS